MYSVLTAQAAVHILLSAYEIKEMADVWSFKWHGVGTQIFFARRGSLL